MGQFRPTESLGPPSGPSRDELEWALEQGAETDDELREMIEKG